MANQQTVLVLLSTDQFSFPLIRFLALEAKYFGWKICIASLFADRCLDRIRQEKFSVEPILLTISDLSQCHHAVKNSDVVIALVPDVVMLMVADICIEQKRTLITPGLITRQMVAKKTKAEENGVLLLFECGLGGVTSTPLGKRSRASSPTDVPESKIDCCNSSSGLRSALLNLCRYNRLGH